MTPSRKPASTDWPRLDLPKYRLQSLTLSWFTAIDDPTDSDDGLDLLEDLVQEGVYSAIIRYVRNGIDLRCVQMAFPRDDGGYDVQVQYEYDPDWLPLRVLNDKQSVDAFAEFARSITDAPVAACRAEFLFPAEAGYETVTPLPFGLGPQTPGPWPIGAVTGLRGIGVNPANPDEPTCRFTLDLEDEGDLWLLLEFAVPTLPVTTSPTTAVKQATALADQFVRRAPG